MDYHFVADFADCGGFVLLAVDVDVLDEVYFMKVLMFGSFFQVVYELAQHSD